MSLLFWDVTEHEIATIIEKLNPAGFEIEADGVGFIAGYCLGGNDFNWLPNNYQTWEEAGKQLIAEIIGREDTTLAEALRYEIEHMDDDSVYFAGSNYEGDEDGEDCDDIVAILDGKHLYKDGDESLIYEEEYEAYLEVYLELHRRLDQKIAQLANKKTA